MSWKLVGQCVAGVVRMPRRALPSVAIAASYESSPVGAFRELAIAVPSRVGLRPGLSVTMQVVDSADARSLYREEWGLPTELGTLSWSRVSSSFALSWQERGVVVRGIPLGLRFPVAGVMRTVSRRVDVGPVLAPRRMWMLAALARVTIDVDESSPAEASVPLAWLAGSHPGLTMTGMRVVALPARVPTGVVSSLRPSLPVAPPTPVPE